MWTESYCTNIILNNWHSTKSANTHKTSRSPSLSQITSQLAEVPRDRPDGDSQRRRAAVSRNPHRAPSRRENPDHKKLATSREATRGRAHEPWLRSWRLAVARNSPWHPFPRDTVLSCRRWSIVRARDERLIARVQRQREQASERAKEREREEKDVESR